MEALGGRSFLSQGVVGRSPPGQRAAPEEGVLAVSLGQLAAVEKTEEEGEEMMNAATSGSETMRR